MLDYQMSILKKVSYDKELFRKEIIKSFRWLKSYEIIQLHFWLKKNFEKSHGEIIRDIFQYIAA
jgi:hypothetical protein